MDFQYVFLDFNLVEIGTNGSLHNAFCYIVLNVSITCRNNLTAAS